jgi:hypothetical protein
MKQLQYVAVAGAFGLLLTASPLAASDYDSPTFNMVVSAGAKTCLPKATATVRVRPAGPVDIMDVTVEGLPANTDFDFFVIQVPKAPFGVAWYQGDIMTDKNGRGHQEFVGRFNVETFMLHRAARLQSSYQRGVPGCQSKSSVQSDPDAYLSASNLTLSSGQRGRLPGHSYAV